MPVYTDLECRTPLTAQLVLNYLHRELADEEEAMNITAYVVKATVRIRYDDDVLNRREWDMQLLGFRDGVEQVLREK